MNKSITRFAQMDGWVFEVKMVRALKVKNYGDPYSTIANLTANGDQMFVDSLLSINDSDFSREDFLTICKFSQTMGMKSVNYDRIKNGLRISKQIDLSEKIQPEPNIRLVKR